MREGIIAPATRRFIASILIVLCISIPPALSAQEKRGVDLIVTFRDGRQLRGELVAVKKDALLLVNPVGMDESVVVADISSIRIPKKSRVLTGLLAGFLIGGIAGGVIGHKSGQGDPWDEKMGTAGGIILFGGLAGLLGLAAGAAMGSDETIRFEKMTDSDVEKALHRLRSKARVRNAG
jgi:hypothetical protein